ncbi:MAG: hypothetical protein KDC48_21740 [Planctomycetes bacterium]|nr:hypothetical protein [Planctomycetota bacterium]
MSTKPDPLPPNAASACAAAPSPAPAADEPTPAAPPATDHAPEWVIALDPATRRFRVDFPDSGSPRQSEEHWLMIALALGLDDADFRERVINTAFEVVIDRAQSH